MFSLICAWIKVWINKGEAGDLRRHRANYDVIVIKGAASYGQMNGVQYTKVTSDLRLNDKLS